MEESSRNIVDVKSGGIPQEVPEVPTLNLSSVNAAFATGTIAQDSDERLTEYLRILCTQPTTNDEVQALANNRCITINTMLTKRFMERVDRTTSRYTLLVILLTVANLAAVLYQIHMAR